MVPGPLECLYCPPLVRCCSGLRLPAAIGPETPSCGLQVTLRTASGVMDRPPDHHRCSRRIWLCVTLRTRVLKEEGRVMSEPGLPSLRASGLHPSSRPAMVLSYGAGVRRRPAPSSWSRCPRRAAWAGAVHPAAARSGAGATGSIASFDCSLRITAAGWLPDRATRSRWSCHWGRGGNSAPVHDSTSTLYLRSVSAWYGGTSGAGSSYTGRRHRTGGRIRVVLAVYILPLIVVAARSWRRLWITWRW